MIALQTLWRLRVVALLLSFLFSLLVTISPRIPQLAVVRVKLSNNGTSVNEMRVRFLFLFRNIYLTDEYMNYQFGVW